MIIYKGEEFKEWNGNALITSLKDETLSKLKFSKNKILNEKIILRSNIGRIRDIEINKKDGKIFLLSDQGSLWKLTK